VCTFFTSSNRVARIDRLMCVFLRFFVAGRPDTRYPGAQRRRPVGHENLSIESRSFLARSTLRQAQGERELILALSGRVTISGRVTV